MLKKIIEKNYKWIIVFLCLIIVLMLLEDIFENEQLELDVLVYKLVFGICIDSNILRNTHFLKKQKNWYVYNK